MRKISRSGTSKSPIFNAIVLYVPVVKHFWNLDINDLWNLLINILAIKLIQNSILVHFNKKISMRHFCGPATKMAQMRRFQRKWNAVCFCIFILEMSGMNETETLCFQFKSEQRDSFFLGVASCHQSSPSTHYFSFPFFSISIFHFHSFIFLTNFQICHFLLPIITPKKSKNARKFPNFSQFLLYFSATLFLTKIYWLQNCVEFWISPSKFYHPTSRLMFISTEFSGRKVGIPSARVENLTLLQNRRSHRSHWSWLRWLRN